MLKQTSARAAVAVGVVLVFGAGAALAQHSPREDNSRAYRVDLQADADGRVGLLRDVGTAGYDGRFFVASADGSKRLEFSGYTQVRYMFNTRDAGLGGDDEASGFQVERIRLTFAGKSDDVSFKVVPAVGGTGRFGLQDALVKYDFRDSGWSIQGGRFKLPFLRESLVSERFTQTVERSDLARVFGQRRSDGVQLAWRGERARFNASLSDGLRTAGTALTDATEADFAVTARGEFLLRGNWSQFRDVTSLGNDETGCMLGVAGHFQTGEENRSDQRSILQYTADLNYEGTDHNVLLAFVGRHTTGRPGNAADASDFGVLLQGGWFPMDQTPLEVFARYALLIPDGDSAGDDPFSSVTAGAAYYFAGHASKFTLDAVVYLDPTTGTVMDNFGPSTTANRLSSDEGGQVAIRAQFQVLF